MIPAFQRSSLLGSRFVLLLSRCLSILVAIGSSVESCQICLPLPTQSLADRILAAEHLVLARENPDRPNTLRAIRSLKESASTLGEDFARAIDELPLNQWSKPVVSGFGVHLVHLDKRVPARVPELDEIRAELERERRQQLRQQTRDQYLQSLLDRYQVTVEWTKNQRIENGAAS